MRNSISHAKHDFEGIRSHNPTKLLCLSPKIESTLEISFMTGSSSREELNRPGTVWCKKCNPYRGMTLHLYRSTRPSSCIACLGQGLSNDDVTSGRQGASYLRRFDRELVSVPATLLKKVGWTIVIPIVSGVVTPRNNAQLIGAVVDKLEGTSTRCRSPFYQRFLESSSSPLMRLDEHFTALRAWCKAMSAWLVKTRRSPFRHGRDAGVNGHMTTSRGCTS